MNSLKTVLFLTLSLLSASPGASLAAGTDFVIYSVFKSLDMGDPAQPSQKDFYVNMGSNNGVREGTVLEVVRKMPTYDLLNQKLYKEISFPIAQIRIIHSEPFASVARLEKLLPADKVPAIDYRSVMVGDQVRFPQ